MLYQVRERFSNHGFQGPHLWYTDNCCKERNILKNIFPSLQADGINPANHDLSVFTCEIVYIQPTYVRNVDLCNNICAAILKSKPKRVGFDLEYTPAALCACAGDGVVSTIQIWVPVK